ncbi:uncharacterized protein FIBRA_03575 [Fibroporia radiculosa]|uniref:MIF4G domain-containing protein n=1 Tax=Fibroporia radiculosa TaxID=599839 RepID=J4H2H2_9APHY|nr:uncharacterized protein FIBRA_03575 [Fibroporia radiculosa]CCM01519.1 predicted protein [Fibroporia radiculosa]
MSDKYRAQFAEDSATKVKSLHDAEIKWRPRPPICPLDEEIDAELRSIQNAYGRVSQPQHYQSGSPSPQHDGMSMFSGNEPPLLLRVWKETFESKERRLAEENEERQRKGAEKRVKRDEDERKEKERSFPSVVATARVIEDINCISYPDGVRRPKVELNVNARHGKFRYDRDFLMQFMAICKEKPNFSFPLDALNLTPVGQASLIRHRGSGHHPLAVLPSTLTSIRFNGAQPFTHDASQDGLITKIRTRTRAKRGKVDLKPVAPLQVSANRWQPKCLGKRLQQVDTDFPEIVMGKVKALLNKLTMKRFDSISNQIIAWMNRSEQEKNGRIIMRVVRLVFDMATSDEAMWHEMYARLCRKIMEQISPRIQDDDTENTKERPIVGGQLLKIYLLDRCKDDFERALIAKPATVSTAVARPPEDETAKAGAEKGTDENILYSGWDGYHAYGAQKAKQGLSFIKFICELFKLQVLTECIMHECVKKLLTNVGNLEEEGIESLCKLLASVGQILDTQKARAHMDVYFSCMKELNKSLKDIVELREREWVPRNQVAARTMTAAVDEAAAKGKAAHETATVSRGGSRLARNRGDQTQISPDGWVVASGSLPRPPPKAGDLSNFGNISKTMSLRLGPTSNFQSREQIKSRDNTTLRGGLSNTTSALVEESELSKDVASLKSGRSQSRRASGEKLKHPRRSLSKASGVKGDSTPAALKARRSDNGDAAAALSISWL